MKSNQKYKYLSDNSFRLANVKFDSKENVFTANVDVPSDKATEVLDANDFYSFDFIGDADMKNAPKLRLTFDGGKGDVYELDVETVHDGEVVGTDEVILECSMYACIARAEKTDEKKPVRRNNGFRTLFSLPSLFGISNDDFPFMGFELPDFDQMVEEAKKTGGHCFVRQFVDDNGHKTEKVWSDGKLTERTFGLDLAKDKDDSKLVTATATATDSPSDPLKAMTSYGKN